MTLGTGIFLSALVLAAIWLFIATKDRWNWKRIAMAPLVIVALWAVVAACYLLYESYENRPQRVTEFWGIKLGMTKDDVLFFKGKPAFASDADQNDLWIYRDDEKTSFHVKFSAEKVASVIAYFSGKEFSVPQVMSALYYARSLKDFEEILGEASFDDRSLDGLVRWYSFQGFNVVAVFERGQIVGTGIYDSERGTPHVSEWQKAPRAEDGRTPAPKDGLFDDLIPKNGEVKPWEKYGKS